MAPVKTAASIADLAGDITGTVLTDSVACAMYSTAAGIYQVMPLAVVRPRDREDVVKTVRWCAANNVPLTVRGAGTSPLGSCLGAGVIIDTTAFMGRDADIHVHDDFVTAPPGASYARINNLLARFGRYLPPDPPAGDYRTIGGMIATNSAGISSIRYGSIIDWVHSLELVLADGTVMQTAPADVRSSQFKEWVEGASTEQKLNKNVYELLRANRELIKARMPNIATNSSGYRLEHGLIQNMFDLGKIIPGSEGTLAIITGATLRTAMKPPVTGVILLYFENVQLAADSVRPVLDASPCSVDLVDATALEQIKNTRPDLAHFIREKAQSVLIVEFDGEDNDEIIPKLMETQRLAETSGAACGSYIAIGEPDVDEARALQKASLNVMHNTQGTKRMTPFVEDIAVAPEMVSSCVRGLCDIMKKHGLEASISGHAGQGSFCPRPMLDLKDPEDIRTMRQVAEEVFAMVVEMGGTISGGSGDGLARTEFLRLQYGDLCDVFAQVKKAFDPNNILNPGIKVSGERGAMASNLRYGADYSHRHVETRLLYHDVPRSDMIEKCHGCGACRTLVDTVAMCPVHKALRAEEASPRAKANVLRHLLSNRGTLPPEDEVLAEVARLTDLCLNCKMCSVECPTGMDVSKLMIELRARRVEKYNFAKDEKLPRMWNTVMQYLATFPAAGNLALRSKMLRALWQKFFGIASRREFPKIKGIEITGRFCPTLTKTREKIALFTDTYADTCSPDVTRCAVEVLIRNSAEVEVISGRESGAERMSYGDLIGTRKAVEQNVKRLAPLVSAGYRIVFLNPRDTIFFRKTMLDCVETAEARTVAAASYDLMQYLLSLHRAGRLDTRFRAIAIPLAYHAPCHLRALQIGKPSVELLRLIPELPIAELEGGCCGMSGTFGIREKNYELSMQVGRPLMEKLRTLEVRHGLTECSSCAIHLRQGSGKRMLHPVQVLHRAYGLNQQTMESW